jgi:predicted kinase
MSEKTLYIMRGVPGAGKSTMAKLIADSTDGVICSTDDLWYDSKGDYNWDPELLEAKHLENQRNVSICMAESLPSIIVDNTNLVQRDVSPYLYLAKVMSYTVQIIDVGTSLKECIARQESRPVDRQVPKEKLTTMYETWQRSRIDPQYYSLTS